MGKERHDLLRDLDEFKRKHSYKECFHKDEECDRGIIRAHSIQNKRILINVADNGRVLMFDEEMNDNSKLGFKMEQIGRASATTFKGFCGEHDSKIFSPIEHKDYCIGDREQEFLFAYRTFAKEYHAEKSVVNAMEKLAEYIYKGEFEKISKGFSKKSPMSEGERLLKFANVQNHLMGLKATLDRMEIYKGEMNQLLDTADFTNIVTNVIEFHEEYHIAVSAMSFIELDIHNNVINDLTDFSSELAPLFVTVFPQKGKTYVLLSYLKKHQEKYGFIKKQILDQDIEEQKVIISNLIVFYFENFAISPRLWGKISTEMQKKICEYHKEAIKKVGKAILNDRNINLFV